MTGLAAHLVWARRALEVAVLRRINAGMPLLDGRSPGDLYLRDEAARARLVRPTLRPQGAFTRSEAEAGSALAEAEVALAAAGADALSRLALRLGLEPRTRALLTLALAIELDLDSHELAGVLIGGGRRRGVLTAAAACDTLGLAPAEVAAELNPAAPLRRLGLIVVDGAGPAATLAARAGLAGALCGETRLPAPLDRAVVLAAPAPAIWLAPVAQAGIDDGAAALRRQPRGVVIVRGPRGSGRGAVGQAIAARLGQPALVCRADRLRELEADADGEAARRQVLSDVLAEAAIRDAVLIVADVDLLGESGGLPPWRRVLLTAHPGPLVLTSSGRGGDFDLERPSATVTVPRPSLADREAAWAHTLATVPAERLPAPATTAGPGGLAAELAARYVLGAGAIAEVVAAARIHAEVVAGVVDQPALEAALGRRLSLDLGAAGTVVTRKARFAELVLPADVVDTLHDVIAMVRERAQILERWGLQRHLGISRGVSALFSGEPGTGKTMAASVLASELGLELIRIDLAAVVSKFVGETEKNLGRIFDQAQDAHAMLLFDEADSLFGKRTELRSAQDRFANLEVNYLLQRMEGFDGISILTTNWESSIDQALLRRLNFRVRFPEPEVEERMELWRRLVPAEAAPEAPVDVRALAERFDMTGGYIKNAIVRAAVIAARAGRRLTADDLWAGALNEYAEMGKVMPSTPTSTLTTTTSPSPGRSRRGTP
jgi:hypothetical protein